jgi:hypothetical protein
LDKYAMTTTSPLNLNELNRQFKGFVADELANEPPSSKYVAGQMSREEFKILVQEFAVDGLTEAQVFYFDLTGDASFEFLNIFHWLTLRADDPSYFAGALTYLETVIPTVFGCYVDACDRSRVRKTLRTKTARKMRSVLRRYVLREVFKRNGNGLAEGKPVNKIFTQRRLRCFRYFR